MRKADRFHGAAPAPGSHDARSEHDGTANDMADEDGPEALFPSQRGEEHACKDFRNGNTGTKPEESI